jgi:hypothetical protein
MVASGLVFLVHHSFSAPKWPSGPLSITGTDTSEPTANEALATPSRPTPQVLINSGGTFLDQRKSGSQIDDKRVGPLSLTRDSTADFGELASQPPTQHAFGANGVGEPLDRPAENPAERGSGARQGKPPLSRQTLLFWIGGVIMVSYWLVRANAAKFG